MSDPMTNLDADEVLASIRRLVAQTHNADGAKAPATAPDSPVSSASDHTGNSAPSALVLTPDFRVAQDVTEPSVAAAQANPAPFILAPEQAVSLPDVAQEITAETVEVETVADVDEAPVDDVQDWSAALDDTPDAEAAQQAASMTLEQRIAELEVAVEAQASEWEPDGSEDLDVEIPREVPRGFAENAGARVLSFGTSEAIIADQPEVPETTETPAELMQEQTKDDPMADIDYDEIADAEVVEETSAVAPEQSVEDVSDAGLEPHIEGAAPDIETETQTHTEEPMIDIDADTEDFGLAGYSNDEMLDEEALREVVAEVIREELQGALGERITRNVRRLVRREVQRAMSLKEFE